MLFVSWSCIVNSVQSDFDSYFHLGKGRVYSVIGFHPQKVQVRKWRIQPLFCRFDDSSLLIHVAIALCSLFPFYNDMKISLPVVLQWQENITYCLELETVPTNNYPSVIEYRNTSFNLKWWPLMQFLCSFEQLTAPSPLAYYPSFTDMSKHSSYWKYLVKRQKTYNQVPTFYTVSSRLIIITRPMAYFANIQKDLVK